MEFDRSLINSLQKSLIFLDRSLSLACNSLMKGKLLSEKPDYIKESERFSEFLKNYVLGEPGGVEKFREKVLKPIYEDHHPEFLAKVIDDGEVKDTFLREGDGISLVFGKCKLPVTKIYNEVLPVSKEKRLVHPPKILLALFAVMFFTVEKEEVKETLDMISVNINLMIEQIEEMTKPPPQEGGNFFQDALKTMNPSKMTEMLGKVNQHPKAKEEFQNIFGKIQTAFQGDDPFSAISEMLKETSMKMAEGDEMPIPVEIESEKES